MKYVGAHLSISKGIENVPKYAKEIGADAFAIFLKNQRTWKIQDKDKDTVKSFKKNLKKFNFLERNILPHSIYLINLGSPEIEIREKSFKTFLFELKTVEKLGLIYLNIHPGSGKGKISK